MSVLIILTAALIFYLPVFLEPAVLLDRGNDLEEFFWPILHFVKQSILTHNQIPLWNNLFLAGTPLVSDPQAPIFYPLNVFALIIPLDTFFLISFATHITLAGVGMYFCSKEGFKFPRKTSVFLGLLYAFTPRLAAYLEAGHVGLIYATAWIPFALWAALKLKGSPKIKYSVFFAVALALIYFSHLPTFLIIAAAFGLLALNRKTFLYLILAAILAFGLTSVSLIPQLEFQKHSTRYLLFADKDVYPKWTSKIEAARAIFVPNMDTEKAIAIGFVPSLLAFLGLLKLKKKQKLLAFSLVTAIGLVILNNASPIYPALLKQNWYLLLRVSTRFWVLIVLLVLYLTGLAIERYKTKLIYAFTALGVLESIFWGSTYFTKPISKNPNLAPKEVYELLASDDPLFRVYCLTRCLSQKEAAIYNLELLDGYSTIQQVNFYKHAWQLTGAYWNYYTLSIPPFGANTENPNLALLGEYNVKYIISKNPLKNNHLILEERIEGFNIYENLLAQPRDYEIDTPNFIRVPVKPQARQLVIPEVYSKGWKAYLDGKKEVIVQQTPSALRAVDLEEKVAFVDFRYFPESFKYGIIVTSATILATAVFVFGRPYFRSDRRRVGAKKSASHNA